MAEFGRTDGNGSDDDFDDWKPPPPLPEGVKKEVVTESETKNWKKPKAGDDVTVHYVGSFLDEASVPKKEPEEGEEKKDAEGDDAAEVNKMFDSSRERGEPVTFCLGKGEVIKGWDLGIASMTKGEISKFTIAPEFAYGEVGNVPAIPPNTTLVFEVELISFVSKNDVFGDGGCEKCLVEEGSGFKHPKQGEEIRMTYKVAQKKEGTVIEEKSGLDYVLGSGELGPLQKVVDKVLGGMNEGEKCCLTCIKDYVYKDTAYGDITIEIFFEKQYEVSDCSLMQDGSVMKKEIKEGDSEARKPQDGWKCVLRVEAATDGVDPLPGFNGPKDLTICCLNGNVCDALEGAASEMKTGDQAVVTCTKVKQCCEAKLGLADLVSSGISKVVFTLEMLEVVKGREVYNMHDEDKVRVAEIRKMGAGNAFKVQRFELALKRYKSCLELLGQSDKLSEETKKESKEMKLLIELNKAACYLQLGDPTSALTSCNVVLKDDRFSKKALFRRAKAHQQRNEFVEAIQDLEKLLELDPDNKDAMLMIPQCKRSLKAADKESQGIFGKMCNGLGKMKQTGRIAPEPKKPERPKELTEEEKTNVAVTFRIEQKLEIGERLVVVGGPDELGGWDIEKGLKMTKAQLPVDLMAIARARESNKPMPQNNTWEAMIDMNESEGRVEYRYVHRKKDGDHWEDGDKHVMQLAAMGSSRVRCKDEWRKAYSYDG